MNQLREWVLRQLRLGRLQELFSMLLAMLLLYSFSTLCVVLVHDSISRGNSIFYTSNLPIILVVGGFVLSSAVSIRAFKLKLTANSIIDCGIRFDIAKDILKFKSDEEMVEFAKSQHINVYVASSEITEATTPDINGKLDSLVFSFFDLQKHLFRCISEQRVFFKKSEFDTAVNKFMSSFHVTESDGTSQSVKSLPEAVSNLLSAKGQLDLRLDDTIGNCSMANSRLSKAEKGKRREQQLTNLAIRVAARLGKSHSGQRAFTTSQVQQVLDDVLTYEEEFQKLTGVAGAIPKGFAGRVRKWLPPEMKSRSGRPKTSKI